MFWLDDKEQSLETVNKIPYIKIIFEKKNYGMLIFFSFSLYASFGLLNLITTML